MSLSGPVEGGLNITLHLAGRQWDAAVTSVAIQSSRPLRVSQVFVGKTIDQSLQLVPLLFNVCAKAQACASVRAIERALGIEPGINVEAIRQAAVDMETLREHLWRIFLDWPKHLNIEPDHQSLAQVLQLQQAFGRALGEVDPFSLKVKALAVDDNDALGALTLLQTLIETRVLNGSCEQWSQLPGWWALAERLQQPAGGIRLLKHIEARGWQAAGDCPVRPLPEFGARQASALVARMQRWDFIAQPTWDGYCCETSSLQRNSSALLSDIKQRSGNGLFARATALISDVVRLIQQLRAYFVRNHQGEGLPGREASAGMAMPDMSHGDPSVGQVSAARGQLIHWLKLEGNIVSDYRILAPTEWNFHPRGMIAEGLKSLRGSAATIRRQAALLIELADPCVGYQLSLDEGGIVDA